MVTRNTLEKRVKLGAHLLDRKLSGWYRTIDLPNLDMENETACILGQTGGDYYDFAKELNLMGPRESETRTIAHGFWLSPNEENPKNESLLAELWAIEVARRLVRKVA